MVSRGIRTKFKLTTGLFLITFLFIIVCCRQVAPSISETIKPEDKNTKTIPFIASFLPEENISYTIYKVKTEESTTITHHTGSKIKIPAMAFVDHNGRPVTGEVEIRYREMHTPWEIMVSGIPMTYKMDSTIYHFESAGMFDIGGMANNQPLIIAADKALEVEMASRNGSVKFNNYYLDTVRRTWIELGKSAIKPSRKADSTNNTKTAPALANPLKPKNTDSAVNILVLEVENRKDFPELDAFENLKFEVVDSRGQYKPGKVPMQCTNPSIIPAEDRAGHYFLQMLVLEKTKSYWISWLVRPTFDGPDYEKAMVIYQKEMVKYRVQLKKQEEQRIIAEKKKKRQEAMERTFRVLNVSKFGIYNADAPVMIKWQEYEPRFVTPNNEKIEMNELMVIDSSINGVVRYNLAADSKIKIDIRSGQKLVGFGADTLLYACVANQNEPDFTLGNYRIKMQRFSNAEELKKFVEK